MGSLEQFQSTVLSSSGALLCIRGAVLCGCGMKFLSLPEVGEHLENSHGKVEEQGEDELVDLKKLFEASFIFPPKKQDVKEEEDDKRRNYVKEPQVIRVILPNSFTCVCLNEHDIGAHSGPSKCHICNEDCHDLESLNKHLAAIHRVSQVLIGQNILFERPPPSTPLPPAFFCPMVKCKYHIAESEQQAHFKTFKLLKQHYKKVHAAKTLTCLSCPAKFGSLSYLDLHKKTCGKKFTCIACKATFTALESLQTHARLEFLNFKIFLLVVLKCVNLV